MRNVELETVIKMIPYAGPVTYDENQGNYVFDLTEVVEGDSTIPSSLSVVQCRVAPFKEEGLEAALAYYGVDDRGLFICRGDGYGSLGFALSVFFG